MPVTKLLEEYIENNIFPLYQNNDEGHRLDHIKYVITRSLEFAKQASSINLDMVYAVAAFHDLAHYIDKDNHEVLSAECFYENQEMKKFFSDDERKIIKEAIEDHRASLENTPRSIYGMIVSSADRNTDISSMMKRTYAYRVKHFPLEELEESINNSYQHILNKYGEYGYAKMYFYDQEFEKFKNDVLDLLNDKYKFVIKYMEANGIVNIKEKAKFFAIKAHHGQIRKNEPDKPMIIHPIGVGKLLESFGYDDNVVAAGYLHDVLEDTEYTKDFLEQEFGQDITSLVVGASEPSKLLSWEERKQHTILEAKKLPLRNKLVICADKINNLEDLFLKFAKTGKRDFSAFKRGEESQKWYYTSIYESLIEGEDKDLPIFKRFKDILDKVFFKKEDLFLKDIIFKNNQSYYDNLKQLHAQKIELQRLKSFVSLTKPFVIEFSGTPRTGKTTTIHNLYDFFKKGGFDVSVVEEFTTSKYYKEELKKEFSKMKPSDKHIAIIEEIYKQLETAISSSKDVILIDRSLNDRQIWNYQLFARGNMSEAQYIKLREKYIEYSKQLIDFLVLTYADPLVSLKRDYNSSLALEKRSFLNLENLDKYNSSLTKVQDLFKRSVDNSLLLDTSNISVEDTSVVVASQVLPVMQKKYIKELQTKYK